ncbi:MAG TPA: 3-phosphoshikimate 1-carboxyvinyltransferase [Candidatus Obscuribacterales bacterium]
MSVKQHRILKGALTVPGDKSISHRAVMFSAFTSGSSCIYGLSPADDCQSTIACLKEAGLSIKRIEGEAPHYLIESRGINELVAPKKTLNAGNSGTTMRLLAGLFAGRPFASVFDGDDSLRRRPMGRVLDHLQEMGAKVEYLADPGKAPFRLSGGNLTGKDFQLTVASAQVETALLLAGLQADGETSVRIPNQVRDHTTRMFAHLGIPYQQEDGRVKVSKLQQPVAAKDIVVPGDISSAAFFIVAAACLPGSDIVLRNVGINPGRTLVLDVLSRMGANILVNETPTRCGEPVANIRVRYNGRLGPATISGEEIAKGIDEIPILSLAGALANGEFIVEGASELRHKESDRLKAIVENLKAAGADVVEREDGFKMRGVESLKGGSQWLTHNDHRLAMSALVAQLVCEKPLLIEEVHSPRISYPSFIEDLENLLEKE